MNEIDRQGNVVLRHADYDGQSYFYVVNTDWKPTTVKLAVPSGTRNLVTGDAMTDGITELNLGPYQLMSFVAPSGKPTLN